MPKQEGRIGTKGSLTMSTAAPGGARSVGGLLTESRNL
jgi:hypothetical protein